MFFVTDAYAGDVRYLYDDLGRLIAVVDATAGQTAIYQYDAVGNLLGIVNQPASTVSLLNFTPKSGPVGTVITLVGTGYSATANLNTVTFNGAAATVTSATTTQLVVTVPAGATTGPISVTTPSGSATSSTPFTVTTGGAFGAPTITSFTPTIGTPDTAVSITGTNYDPTPSNNALRFNINAALVTTATPTTLTTTVPAIATSGRISVGTALGTATSSNYFFVPPSPYTSADVQVTGTLTFGSSQPVSITTGGKIGLFVFDGIAEQKVSLLPTGSTMTPDGCGLHTLKILSTDGATLSSTDFCTGDIAGPATLPVTGTYTVLVDPYSTSTGNVTLTLYDVVDILGPITPGGAAVPVALPTPGQVARLTFSGTANQKVSVVPSGSTVGPNSCVNQALKLLNPDGTTLSSTDFCTGDIAGPATLPVTGTYTVLVDPIYANTGNVTVTLYTIVDITGTLTIGGSAVAVTLTTPGQIANLTFAGTASQLVTVRVTGNTINSVVVRLLKPDNSVLTSTSSSAASFNLTQQTLPTTGTYTVQVDPPGVKTGGLNVSVTSP